MKNLISNFLKIFFSIPEKMRFILVGGFNTLFGFTLFFCLYSLLKDKFHYITIFLSSGSIAMLIASLNLKFFVFRSKGSFLKEISRCYITYSLILLANSILLYLIVELLSQEVIISQIIVTLILIVLSYIGHKYYSFRK